MLADQLGFHRSWEQGWGAPLSVQSRKDSFNNMSQEVVGVVGRLQVKRSQMQDKRAWRLIGGDEGCC